MPRLRTPEGHLLPLPPHRVSLGESPGCDVPIAPGHAMAGVHLHLQPWECGYFLEDAASGLGTLVNGSSVTWAPLKHGDAITAGSLTLRYKDENGPPLAAFPDNLRTAKGKAEPQPQPQPPPHHHHQQQQPPSWLPAEALLPPLSPVAQAALQNAPAQMPEQTGCLRAVALLVLMAAAAVAGWWFFVKR